jgi:hypothetical protein
VDCDERTSIVCARDARNQLERETGDAPLGEPFRDRRVVSGPHERHEDGARGEERRFAVGGWLHLEHRARARAGRGGVVGHPRALRGIRIVPKTGALTCSALHDDVDFRLH